jgi:hypothetical protein
MKRFVTASTICFLFLFAGMLTAYAQDEHQEKQEEKKEVRQEEKKEVRHEDKREVRRVTDEHYRAHFGREHHFAVRKVVVVGGERRFQYGGYWFGFGQPWPAGWAYSDNCYIELIDGTYYLFNLRHPGVRIAVNVVG